MICVCSPRFCFSSKSLFFIPNHGHYTPMSMCFPPNGLLFTPIMSSGFDPWALSRPSVGEWEKLGGGVDSNGWSFAGVCSAIFAWDVYCANPNPKSDTHSNSWICKGLGDLDPWITHEYDLATVISICPLTQPLTWKMGLSIFAAMGRLKVASMACASLSIISSIERINRLKCLCWPYQLLPCLSLLIFSHRSNILYIPSGFQVSTFSSPNMTSMIASVWFSNRPQIDMSPHVLGMLPPWRTSSSYIWITKWIRGSPFTQLVEKACLER